MHTLTLTQDTTSRRPTLLPITRKQVNPGEQVKKPLGGCDKHPCLCTRHPFIEIFLDPATKLDEQSCFSSAGSAKSLRGMTRPIQLLLLHKCLSKGQCSFHIWMGPDMNMLCRYNWFAQAIGSFPPQSHLIIVRQVGTMCLEDVLVRSRIFYFFWLVLLLEVILLPELSDTCLQQYVALSKENKTGSKQSVLSCVLLARPMNMKRWEWWW